MMHGWHDVERGVEVRPSFGNQVTICYNGLLAKSGADQVFLHYGYGDPKNWRDVGTIAMDKTFRGWEKTIPLKDRVTSFCFKDSANNWDNNNGYNWTLQV